MTFSSLSFWSTGVFLIRALSAYQIWDNTTRLVLFFVLSIPLVIFSIASMKRMFAATYRERPSFVYLIIAFVILMHALALVLYPEMYAFHHSTALSAAAWLLWFSGVAILTIRLIESRSIASTSKAE